MIDATVHERINAALHFRMTDRLPLCDFLDNERLFRYFSPEGTIGLAEKARAYQELGIDVCWRCERRQVRESGLRRVIGWWHRRPRSRVLSEAELRAEVEDFRSRQRLFEPRTYLAMNVPGCLSDAVAAVGIADFARRMYSDPFDMERLIEVFAENLYLRADALTRDQRGGIFFIRETLARGREMFFSRHFLEKAWALRIRKIVDLLHQRDVKVVLHSPGNFMPVVDILVDCGIDGLHPLEAAAGMDWQRLRQEYSTLVLFTSLDIGTDALSDVPDVVAAAMTMSAHLVANRGVFCGSLGDVTPALGLPRILAFYTALGEATVTGL
ncbi:MAG: hypothetical protein NC924_10030 [Candidatus Omnitrophica bacterium]|nr:hypothetical protein [Candidatus Omnitrophota bacterium]